LNPESIVSGLLSGNPGSSCHWKKSCDCSRRREKDSNYETRIFDVQPGPSDAVGGEMISTSVAQLIDTNVLVYRVDARFPKKQEAAANLLEETVRSGECRIPHQALLEFYAVVTRPLPGVKRTLLTSGEAREEIEVLLLTSIILYPVENVVRLGLYATAAFGLNWFDAHLWAYAEHYRCSMIYSEDFEHGRYYGSVKVINPFI
jgi:predicted nucleic acid-binding protein